MLYSRKKEEIITYLERKKREIDKAKLTSFYDKRRMIEIQIFFVYFIITFFTLVYISCMRVAHITTHKKSIKES